MVGQNHYIMRGNAKSQGTQKREKFKRLAQGKKVGID